MAKFEIAEALTAVNEGFYSNDPVDAGGETIYGIARKKNPNAEIFILVDNYRKLSGFPGNMKGKPDIIAAKNKFYITKFWNVVRGDEIINQEVANALYDSAVNMGQGTAIKLTQRTLGIRETGTMDDFTLKTLNENNNYA